MPLANKRIILGVSGSIAAYKAALIVRLLVKAGAEVRVLMTQAATDFITPLTLASLSRHPVTSSVHDGETWNNHVEMGLWADAMIVAPATATTLGKMATGICDSAIVAVYLSARCPVFFAPAMDLDMWAHPATQRNVELLQAYGNHLIQPGEGELASGLNGPGRLAEPEDILKQVADYLHQHPAPANSVTTPPSLATRPAAEPTAVNNYPQDLQGVNILITAGPTYEDLDPIRYLGNRSTGRMGIALAEAAAARGATVQLVLGPTPLATEATKVQTLRVRTAREMHAASVALWPKADVGILAAAVADYRPKHMAEQKIKKKDGPLEIELVRNPDIAVELGHDKKPHQLLVGFALETENGTENAREKLERKNFDFIVLNTPSEEGTGFGYTTNRVQIVTATAAQAFELKAKSEVAHDILDAVVNHRS